MRSREKPIFLTADQLEERASARIEEVRRLPPGEARRHALKNATQLRSYAAMKRHLAPELASTTTNEGSSDVGS